MTGVAMSKVLISDPVAVTVVVAKKASTPSSDSSDTSDTSDSSDT